MRRIWRTDSSVTRYMPIFGFLLPLNPPRVTNFSGVMFANAPNNGWNVPGPFAERSAISPASANSSNAATAATSGGARYKSAIKQVSEHLLPGSGHTAEPPETRATRIPSATKSCSPEIATTPRSFANIRLRPLPRLRGQLRQPWAAELWPLNARISEAFPQNGWCHC